MAANVGHNTGRFMICPVSPDFISGNGATAMLCQDLDGGETLASGSGHCILRVPTG